MTIHLESEIGTELHLEVDGHDGRVICQLIGVLPEKLLILSVPDKVIAKFTPDTPLADITLRGISRGQAFGFKVPCLRIINQPETLLMLAFPSSIQEQTIRKNRRVKCLLPAKLEHQSVAISGVIADLSNDGCHFQTSTELSDQQQGIVQIGQPLDITFELPGKAAPETIEAVIRNTFVDEHTVHIGLEFKNISTATKQVVDEFVALSFEIASF